MTDREKAIQREMMIETLRSSGYGFFVTHETTNADEALADAADALIAAGIGDTTNLIVENKVLQRALLTTCVKLIEDEVDNVNAELLARVVYTKAFRKAEKELAEERKDD